MPYDIMNKQKVRKCKEKERKNKKRLENGKEREIKVKEGQKISLQKKAKEL